MFFDRKNLKCWFAIDIAIRYRYRSRPAFSISSSDIDSEPERTTAPVAARLRYTTIRPFLVFCARFRSALFAPKGLRIIAQGCGVSRYPGFAGQGNRMIISQIGNNIKTINLSML